MFSRPGLAVIATLSSSLLCLLFHEYISRLHKIVESCTGMHNKFLNGLQSGGMARFSQLDIKCCWLQLLRTILLF